MKEIHNLLVYTSGYFTRPVTLWKKYFIEDNHSHHYSIESVVDCKAFKEYIQYSSERFDKKILIVYKDPQAYPEAKRLLPPNAKKERSKIQAKNYSDIKRLTVFKGVIILIEFWRQSQ